MKDDVIRDFVKIIIGEERNNCSNTDYDTTICATNMDKNDKKISNVAIATIPTVKYFYFSDKKLNEINFRFKKLFRYSLFLSTYLYNIINKIYIAT